MGVDVLLIWEGMTFEDWIKVRAVSHLHEAYHGEPYATSVLIDEGVDENVTVEKKRMFVGTHIESEYELIPVRARKLRDILPKVLKVAMERQAKLYHENATIDSPEIRAFSDFVELAEKKEKEGKKLYISVSY